MGRAIFSTEPEFPKILLSMLSRHTSNVNVPESQNGQSNCIICMCRLAGVLIHLNFIILILICF